MAFQFQENLIQKEIKGKASRLAFGEELAKLGEKHPEIVALDADLSKSTRTDLFAAKFPDRFFNMGIAEANMIGTAAGLALSGKIPYAASFGCFLTGRFDQIRMSVSFTGANVRLIGTHSGVGIGEDGHSQMALEDLSLMRSFPNMIVFQPGDEEDTQEIMRWSVAHKGPIYLRLTRQDLPALKRKEKSFSPGHWDVLVDENPQEVVLLASGSLVSVAIKAADIIQEKTGKTPTLVNANWIQPLDEKFLKSKLESKCSMLVTLEDHYRKGGLGGAVAEYISQFHYSPRLLRIGVDEFGQSGTPQQNYEHYGFTPEKIAQKILFEMKTL